MKTGNCDRCGASLPKRKNKFRDDDFSSAQIEVTDTINCILYSRNLCGNCASLLFEWLNLKETHELIE